MISSDAHPSLNTLGSSMCTVAVQQRLAGVVLDGFTRDVEMMERYGFSVYARGTCVTWARGRIGLDFIDESIAIEGKKIRAGWICAADVNGVIFFPEGRGDEIFV